MGIRLAGCFAIAIAVALALGGCAFDLLPERGQLLVNGKHSELADHMEKQIAANGGKATTADYAHLCWAYSALKTYDKLSQCLDAMDRGIQAGDHSLGLMDPFKAADPMPAVWRAQMYIEFGDYLRAIGEAKRGLKVSEDKSVSTWSRANLLAMLGLASAFNHDPARAHQALDELRAVSMGGGDSSIKDINLARMYMALSDYANAKKYLETEGAFHAITNVVTGASASGASIFMLTDLPKWFMHAKCQLELGNVAAARSELDALLKIPQIRNNGDLYWLILFERGRVAEKDGQRDVAIRLYSEAIGVIEQVRATINTESSKIGFVGDKQAAYASLIALLVANRQPIEALAYVERSKARALVDMLASKKDFAVDAEQTRAALARLDAADQAARVQGTSAEYATGAPARNLQVARGQIAEAAPELATLVSVSVASPQDLRRLLGPREALVEYYYDAGSFFAFVLDQKGVAAFRLNGSGLEKAVLDLRAAMEQPGGDDWKPRSRALYDRLWAPVAARVADNDVIVVPHGILHYVPFDALYAADGRFLIDRQGLRFLPAASVLRFLQPVSRPNPLLLALGNPDLGDPTLDLKFAESEARAVAKMFPNSRLLTRQDASKENLKAYGNAFARIHIASHGKFEAESPLQSGVYLAKGAKTAIADGVLTVGELYTMRLKVDLVTLSACETGLGKVANGDDVVGLNRGFLYAGSRSIVSSLWSVDDEATGFLMVAFYGHLAKSDKRQALRSAQLETRQKYPHPFYWAAFYLTGRAD